MSVFNNYFRMFRNKISFSCNIRANQYSFWLFNLRLKTVQQLLFLKCGCIKQFYGCE